MSLFGNNLDSATELLGIIVLLDILLTTSIFTPASNNWVKTSDPNAAKELPSSTIIKFLDFLTKVVKNSMFISLILDGQTTTPVISSSKNNS